LSRIAPPIRWHLRYRGFCLDPRQFGHNHRFGAAGYGISLASGGSVTNGQSGGAGGLIAGQSSGVAIAGTTGTVVNFGTINR